MIKNSKRGPGRPLKRGPGRPLKRGPGRPLKRGPGRPRGAKNKKEQSNTKVLKPGLGKSASSQNKKNDAKSLKRGPGKPPSGKNKEKEDGSTKSLKRKRGEGANSKDKIEKVVPKLPEGTGEGNSTGSELKSTNIKKRRIRKGLVKKLSEKEQYEIALLLSFSKQAQEKIPSSQGSQQNIGAGNTSTDSSQNIGTSNTSDEKVEATVELLKEVVEKNQKLIGDINGLSVTQIFILINEVSKLNNSGALFAVLLPKLVNSLDAIKDAIKEEIKKAILKKNGSADTSDLFRKSIFNDTVSFFGDQQNSSGNEGLNSVTLVENNSRVGNLK